MKAATILSLILLFIISCGDEAVEQVKLKTELEPLEYIPNEFQFVAMVDMIEAMQIPGISDRLRYEAKRKPSLQLVPIDQVKKLYLAADSGEDTENKGGVYIAILKENIELKDVINEYKEKFKSNKDVIVSTKEFRKQSIFTIRDKKQELAFCQLSVNAIISGPLDKVLQSLKAGENNISKSESLEKLMKINPGHCIKIYLLSSDKLGTLLQQLKFFDQLAISAKGTEKGGFISLTSLCKDKETAEKAKGALQLAQFALQFKIGKYTNSGDMLIKLEGNTTTGTADLSSEALKELLIKK